MHKPYRPTAPATTPRALHTRWIAGASVALLATLAQAESSPYYIGASLSYAHDSNLLRLRDESAVTDRSDKVTTAALLAGIDQPIGRQRIFGNVALRSNRFADNDQYDNQSYTAVAGLDWSTVERLSGNLTASANRALSSFNLQGQDGPVEKNLETARTLDAAVRLGLVTEYSFELTGGYRQIDNSLARVQTRDYRQNTVAAGVHWRPSPDSDFGLALRDTRGRYPRYGEVGSPREVDRFKRQDVDLSASIKPSGASTLSLRLSNGKTEYDLDTGRDFSGFTGSLGWLWQVSGKLRLNTRLARETGQDSYVVTDFFGNPGTTDYSRINNSLRVKADYELSAKIALNLAVTSTQRDIVLTQSGSPGDTPSEGRERNTAVSLGARWTPVRSVMLGCDLGNERQRHSGQQGVNLKATTTSCFAQFTLQ